ncbi:MAG TPA: RHS repeat-associated core domain-containing protein, partial [Polyangia bacterium]|nr:RHS repeat-associated core domain-containing protein [Polyangia bacterium]
SSTTRGSSTETRSHNAAHELTAVGGATLGYDARGNLKSNDRGDTFSWDYENRLTKATRSGASATYVYDATGRKVARTAGGKTTVYVHRGPQIVAEYVDGVLSLQHLVGGEVDDHLAFVKAGKLYWYHTNSLGTVNALTDEQKAVRERYSYTAYGERTIWSPSGSKLLASALGNEVGFTGRTHDADSGLMDFRFRQYDPRLGRFISRDDEYHDGLNLYMAYYVPNGTDPTGHWRLVKKWLIAGIRLDIGIRLQVGGKTRQTSNGESVGPSGIDLIFKLTAGLGFRLDTPAGRFNVGAFTTKEWPVRLMDLGGPSALECSNRFNGCCGYDTLLTGWQSNNLFQGLEGFDLFELTTGFSRRGCKLRWDMTLRIEIGKFIPVLREIEVATMVLNFIGLDGLKTSGYVKFIGEVCLGTGEDRQIQWERSALLSGEGGLSFSIGNPP